jgi:hypothetical protein
MGIWQDLVDGFGRRVHWSKRCPKLRRERSYKKLMEPLSPEGLEIIEELARRYGVSTQAVTTLLQAVISGHGTMAQFSHPELGGLGQWAQGGMTMIGDMFNDALKAKVNGLCSDLANLLRSGTVADAGISVPRKRKARVEQAAPATSVSSSPRQAALRPPGGAPTWAPLAPLVHKTISDMPIFQHRGAWLIAIGDHVTIYDTADHGISGVSQQQSGDASLSFVSQRGLVRVADLRVVSKK